MISPAIIVKTPHAIPNAKVSCIAAALRCSWRNDRAAPDHVAEDLLAFAHVLDQRQQKPVAIVEDLVDAFGSFIVIHVAAPKSCRGRACRRA